MPIKKTKARYDEEFQRNAVDMTIHGKSVKQVAENLGVPYTTLHRWREKFFAEDGPQRSNLREENERLRREVAELRDERDILKKSVAIFLKPRR